MLSNSEKRGGRIRSEASFQDMRRMVRTCNFTDLKSIGDRFSWVGQRGDQFITSCLDRTMANNEWHSLFPAFKTEFLEFGESDHRPLVTYSSDFLEERRHIFRYDSRLTHKEGFRNSVLKDWNGASNSSCTHQSLSYRISRCWKQILVWKRSTE